MRWLEIRKAAIDPELRQTFEQHGIGTMQALLAARDRYFEHRGETINAIRVRGELLAWLTEQHDLADRRESWNLTMEVAIVVLIVIEIMIQLASSKTF